MKILTFLFTLMFSSIVFAEVAIVSALKGSASIERNQEEINVEIGTPVLEKDVIKTGSNSRLQMIFKDKTVITLGKNTEFSVKEYLFDDSSSSKANFSLAKGFLKSVTGKIGKVAPQRFTVKTKTSTIGIRGTIFTLEANDRFTRLTTLSGATFFKDNLNGKVYDIPKNSQLTFNQESQQVEVIQIDTETGETTSSVPAEYYETASTVSDADQTQQNDVTNLDEGDNSSSTQKVIEGSGTYARYGYWERVFDQQMTEAFAEAIPGQDITLPATISEAIANSHQASYTGNIVAFDMPKNKGTGTITINVVFNPNSVGGQMDYTIDGTRWLNNFSGTVNAAKSGFQIDGFTAAGGDVTGTVGNMSGTFYGPLAQEAAGTFELTGSDNSTGLEKHSTGSFLGSGSGITP